jgi:sugar lactone lactonase YvrE
MRKLFLLFAVLSLALTVAAQDGPPPMPEIDGEIFVEGLNGPQGLYVDADGNLWVAENGVGGEEEVTYFNVTNYEEIPGNLGNSARLIRVAPDGTQEVVAELPSVAAGQDILGTGRIVALDGQVYFTHGQWISSLGDVSVPNFAAVNVLTEDGAEVVASTFEHESANNPDGLDLLESHPYGIAAGPDGLLYVADASANALISVNPETGETATVAAFEPLPGVFPSELYGGEMLAQPVPTAVAFDDAGTLYVSFLSGAPFVPGSAKVVTVSEDGEVSDFATGLTMLTDLEYAPDGNLYATQFAIFGQQGPEFNSGAVVRILPDGSHEVVVAGLPNVTAIAFDADGNGYVAINGANPPGIVPPGIGMVVKYEDLVNREAVPMEEMEEAPAEPEMETTEES